MQAEPNLSPTAAEVNPSLLEKLRQFAPDFCESQTSPQTRDVYRGIVRRFLDWYQSNGRNQQPTATTIKRFRAAWSHRAPRTANLYTTVTKVFLQAAAGEHIISWESFVSIKQIRNLPSSTVRPGCWLDLDTAIALIAAPDPKTLKGLRDRAILGVLIGTGLRRKELTELRFEHLRHLDGHWVIWRLEGKGRRIRDVPMEDWTKQLIDDYAAAANLPNEGVIFRRTYNRTTTLPGALRGERIRAIIKEHGVAIGLPHLAPHDLRRTFAMLSHKGGSPLRQISFSLGHGSVAVTERYLAHDQSFTDTPASRLGITAVPQHRKRVVPIDTATASAVKAIARTAQG